MIERVFRLDEDGDLVLPVRTSEDFMPVRLFWQRIEGNAGRKEYLDAARTDCREACGNVACNQVVFIGMEEIEDGIYKPVRGTLNCDTPDCPLQDPPSAGQPAPLIPGNPPALQAEAEIPTEV